VLAGQTCAEQSSYTGDRSGDGGALFKEPEDQVQAVAGAGFVVLSGGTIAS
jgi:hypothetical protein